MSKEFNFPPKPEVDRSFVMQKTSKVLTLEDLAIFDTKLSKPALPEATAPPEPLFDEATRRAFIALSERKETSVLFEVRRADEWLSMAASTPTPRMLFDSMWYEGDLCILFADTNVGKSILAVQIGDSISRGEAIPGFEMTVPAQPIAYFDFELSAKQFHARYTDGDDMYPFSDNFYRAELDMSTSYVELGLQDL
jgi:hypothetical protein